MIIEETSKHWYLWLSFPFLCWHCSLGPQVLSTTFKHLSEQYNCACHQLVDKNFIEKFYILKNVLNNDRTMIKVWIMEKMVIMMPRNISTMPSPWHDMIMAMFSSRSWYDPGMVAIETSSDQFHHYMLSVGKTPSKRWSHEATYLTSSKLYSND